MDTTGHTLTLAAYALGFIAVGVGVGIAFHHFCLGWFISLNSRGNLEAAIGAAERHLIRQAKRKHARAHRRHVREVLTPGAADKAAGELEDLELAAKTAPRAGGRHLAR